MTNDLIASSVMEATIHAAADSIDLAEWVFTLTDDEYHVRNFGRDHTTLRLAHVPFLRCVLSLEEQ
jgi:hypothetical protein